MADLNDDIKKYLRGEMSPAEMHALEKRALDDPFLEEALEGVAQLDANSFDSDLKKLKRSLEERISESSAKTVSLWVWSVRIAAGLLLIVVSTFVIIRLTEKNAESDLAQQTESSKGAGDKGEEAAIDSSTLSRDAAAEAPGAPAKPQVAIPAEREEQERPAEAKNESKPEAAGPSAAAIVEDQQDGKAKADDQLAEVTERVPQDSISVARSETETKAVARKKAEAEEATLKQLDDSDKRRVAASQPASPVQGYVGGVKMSRVIQGRVESEDGIGLPGVNVMFKNTNIGTVTDGSGNYKITVPDNSPSLVFSFIGFSSEEVEAGDKSQVDVRLHEDVSQLSEIVVMGHFADGRTDDEEKPETLELANPYGGRRAYKQYLEKSMQYPEQALANNVEGKVTIQFTVESSGQLSNFTVLKGIGHGCEEEVIRLVKQGPKWNPTRRNTESLRDRVKVRMKFTLPKK